VDDKGTGIEEEDSKTPETIELPSNEVGVSSGITEAELTIVARPKKQLLVPKLPPPKRSKGNKITTPVTQDAVQLEDKGNKSSDGPGFGRILSASPIPDGRRQSRAAEAGDPPSPPCGQNWEEEDPQERALDSDEEKMAAAIAHASVMDEPVPDISNHIYGGADLHNQEDNRKEMEAHVFGRTVFEVAFEDLEIGNVVATVVGSSWKGRVAATGFFRVTGVDPVVVVAVIPTPVVPFKSATIQQAELDGKATCFVANNIGVLKLSELSRKGEVGQYPELQLAIFEGLVSAKRLKKRAEATVPFPQRPQ
jgi:hypothetical protein